jgi:hypothetical protein
VARSTWEAILKKLNFAPDLATLRADLISTIKDANKAKREAEEAAVGAKEAATLTAVTNLASAYQEEANGFRKRSYGWAAVCIVLGLVAAFLMTVFVRESLTAVFSVPQAIIRTVILGSVFGVLTISIRVYESYLHLEVVNRHRVCIGRRFEAFKAAQPTEHAKEIMAAITAEHMLSFGKSGFAPKDSPNAGPLPVVSDLVKAILEKK